MTEYPTIGDKVVLLESIKQSKFYAEYFTRSCSQRSVDDFIGKESEVVGVGKWLGYDYFGYCDITDGQMVYRVPLEFVEGDHVEADVARVHTNADKIRHMSDSELTEELYRLMGNAAKCPDCFWKSGRERLELYLKMGSK